MFRDFLDALINFLIFWRDTNPEEIDPKNNDDPKLPIPEMNCDHVFNQDGSLRHTRIIIEEA